MKHYVLEKMKEHGIHPIPLPPTARITGAAVILDRRPTKVDKAVWGKPSIYEKIGGLVLVKRPVEISELRRIGVMKYGIAVASTLEIGGKEIDIAPEAAVIYYESEASFFRGKIVLFPQWRPVSGTVCKRTVCEKLRFAMRIPIRRKNSILLLTAAEDVNPVKNILFTSRPGKVLAIVEVVGVVVA